jgi:hypothetical protein
MITNEDRERHSAEYEEAQHKRSKHLNHMYESCNDGMCGAEDCLTCHPDNKESNA